MFSSMLCSNIAAEARSGHTWMYSYRIWCNSLQATRIRWEMSAVVKRARPQEQRHMKSCQITYNAWLFQDVWRHLGVMGTMQPVQSQKSTKHVWNFIARRQQKQLGKKKKTIKWLHAARQVQSKTPEALRCHINWMNDGIYNRFKAEMFTVASELQMLVRTVSEVVVLEGINNVFSNQFGLHLTELFYFFQEFFEFLNKSPSTSVV